MTFRALLLLPLALLLPSLALAQEPESFSPENQPAYAYDLMSRQLFNDAVLSLEEFHETHQPTRDTRYAHAAGLINFQPVTSDRIQQAFDAAAALVKENPTDEVGVQAKYLQARIDHVHRDNPDEQAALKHYRELTESSQHPIAQRALARVVLLELFTFDPNDPAKVNAQAKLPELSARAQALTDPLAIRLTELMLADAILYYGWDKAQAVTHLERALAHNVVRERLEGDMIMMVARTSQELGDTEKALKYYRQFAETQKRDIRTHTVERMIRELESAPGEAASQETQATAPTAPNEPAAAVARKEMALQPENPIIPTDDQETPAAEVPATAPASAPVTAPAPVPAPAPATP